MVLLGTDTGNPFVIPGYAAADELSLLVDAGLSPYEALRTGTSEPAVYLGHWKDQGSVEIGKRADLILLNANPLRDIRAVRKPAGVMMRGAWLSAEQLASQLEAQAARNAGPGHRPQ